MLTWQRKVQVYKGDDDAEIHPGEVEPDRRPLRALAAGLRPGARLQSAGPPLEPRTATSRTSSRAHASSTRAAARSRDEHIAPDRILDNTSQVHCNQFMIDLRPRALRGGQAHHLRRHSLRALPRTLVPRRGRQRPGRRHLQRPGATRPRSSRETPSSPRPRSLGTRDHPDRADLGIVETRLLGHKFERDRSAAAPAGPRRTHRRAERTLRHGRRSRSSSLER